MTPTLPDLAKSFESLIAEARLVDGLRGHAHVATGQAKGYMLDAADLIDGFKTTATAFLAACAQAERETAELRAEVSGLQERLDYAVKYIGRYGEMLINAGYPAGDRDVQLGNLAQALAELSALRAEAAKVLRPFAGAADTTGAVPDDWMFSSHTGVLHRDLRAAAALLVKIEAGEAGRTFADVPAPISSSGLRGAVKEAAAETQSVIRALARGGKEGA